jgi:hypothetical protein
MAKKDINTMLSSSPKQRALLLAEDRARGKFYKERLLTEIEKNLLLSSFKNQKEVKTYEDIYKLEERVSNAIINLQGMMFSTLWFYSILRGYVLKWSTLENMELLVNSVLHEIKDPKERIKIAEKSARGLDLILTQIGVDEEGYVDIDIDFELVLPELTLYRDETKTGKSVIIEKERTREYCLLYGVQKAKQDIEGSVIQFKSLEKALLDLMKNTGFNVKTYKDKIKQLNSRIYSPTAILPDHWSKYRGEGDVHNSRPRMEKLLKKYDCVPNVKDLEVDEDKYNFFYNRVI